VSRARALLVDLDGTLVDTRTANFSAYAAALAEAGVAVDRASWDRVAEGRNWRQFLPGLLAGTGVDPASVAARKASLYPRYLSETRLNERLAALVRTVRTRCATGLVSTASAASARAVLRHHDIESLFDIVITGSDVVRHKPAPDAYLLASTRLRVSPAECLVFEDSDIGVAAAAAFGARCRRICFAKAPPALAPRRASRAA
jgi:HAD superfamily hydrolase (TIGR01509 family)